MNRMLWAYLTFVWFPLANYHGPLDVLDRTEPFLFTPERLLLARGRRFRFCQKARRSPKSSGACHGPLRATSSPSAAAMVKLRSGRRREEVAFGSACQR